MQGLDRLGQRGPPALERRARLLQELGDDRVLGGDLLQPCAHPRLDLARALLDAGADVEARDNEGKTPAEHAAESMPVRHAVLEVLGQS